MSNLDFLRKIFEGKDKERRGNLIIVFCVGVLMLIISSSLMPKSSKISAEKSVIPLATIAPKESNSYQEDLEKKLENIFSKVSGAGKVYVMVTLSQGKETVLAKNTDETLSSNTEKDEKGITKEITTSTKKNTAIILSNSQSGDEPLIITEKTPKVEGVLIVCDGGGDIVVKDSLIRSCEAMLGIPAYKIEVLKGNENNLEKIKN